MFKQSLKEFKSISSGYNELRIQRNCSNSIVLVDGNLIRNEQRTESGLSSRSFQNGYWGFASNTQVSERNIHEAIALSSKNANFLASKVGKKQISLHSRPTNLSHDLSTKKLRLSQKDKIQFLQEIDAYLFKNYPQLKSRTVVLNELDMEKNLLTFDGSEAYSLIPRVFIYVDLQMIKEGSLTNLYDVFGGGGQFEENFTKVQELFPKLDRLVQRLTEKSEGDFPQAGVFDCVLDSKLGGILAHEAVGHPVEADLVLGGSIAGDLLHKEVASPLVNLVDFAHSAFGKTCPIPVWVDDEGTHAQDATIIENGILKSFLHNKDSAHHFGHELTGNARAYTFSDEPLIRMRNTAFLPGKSKLQDMIASIENGYYLINTGNGQADSTSEFMFAVTFGYEIKNGKLGKAIKDTTISGIAFDMLKTVSMVSDELFWSSGGMCGKKQPIPVGMGGPAVKCRMNIGGK